MDKGVYMSINRTELKFIVLLVVASVFVWGNPSDRGELKDEKKARGIIEKALNRDDGKSNYTESQILTCTFKEVKGKNSCVSQPRSKLFEGVAKDTGKNGKDTVSLNIMLEPADERNIAFLQKDYDDESKDSEQFIYFPAMKKLKRIVSETPNGPKTGSVFGSELAYEDIEKAHLNDYAYSYEGETVLNGINVWIIVSYPTDKKMAKTSYGKSIQWIDQKSYIPLQVELYDKQGHKVKTLYNRNIEKIGGVYVARQMIIVNHKTSRMSMMQIKKYVADPDVDESVFSTRALEDVAYRESIMAKIRKRGS